MIFCTFWRLQFTKWTKFTALKMAKMAVLALLESSKLISRKSVWYKNHEISTLCKITFLQLPSLLHRIFDDYVNLEDLRNFWEIVFQLDYYFPKTNSNKPLEKTSFLEKLKIRQHLDKCLVGERNKDWLVGSRLFELCDNFRPEIKSVLIFVLWKFIKIKIQRL